MLLTLCAEWYSYIDFLKWGWHSQMVNQFEKYPDVLLNGRPVLVSYSLILCCCAALYAARAWAMCLQGGMRCCNVLYCEHVLC